MAQTTEAEILENIVPEYEAQGYDVFVHPAVGIKPAFMGAYTPDAIALRTDKNPTAKNVAIEVTRGGEAARERLELVLSKFEKQSDWELRLIWISSAEATMDLPIQSARAIEMRLSEVEKMIADGHDAAALLMAWAIFEAVGRALLADKLQRRQTAGRLVETLASEGLLTPDEADELRMLARVRNDLVHGALETHVDSGDLKRFTEILSNLHGLVPA